MDRPLVVLALQTANRRGAPHLVELGAVRIEEGEVVDTFEALVAPSVPIDPEATALHGIDDEAVRHAPQTGAVLVRFRDWVGADWMAAHDARALAEALGFEHARTGVEPPEGVLLDVLPLARTHLADAPGQTLEDLAAYLELEDLDPHRALPAATIAWKVLEECLERRGGLAGTGLTELLVAGGGPLRLEPARPPHLPRRLRALEAALGGEHETTLLYGEPPEPPAELAVFPRLLFERGGKAYMEAECARSGLLKTYLLERVTKVLTS